MGAGGSKTDQAPPGPAFQQLSSENGEDDPNGPVFWDHSKGLYFTYTTRQVRIALIRRLMQLLVVGGIFCAYFFLWDASPLLTFAVACGSCGATCAGLTWLTPSCLAGFVATIIKGVRLGFGIGHIDIRLTSTA